MVIFEQGLKCNQGVNGKFVLGRRLSLGEDPAAVIMAYSQKSREASRTRAETAKKRVAIDKSSKGTDGGGDRMVAYVQTELKTEIYFRKSREKLLD